MTRRSRGREIALQVLYQLEQNPSMEPSEVQAFLELRLRDPKLRAFAMELINGVSSQQERLDAVIRPVAENWSIERMAAIDRNILRLGAFEMLFRPEVPLKVAINEALELAKRYSTAQSSRFVNGILDRLQGTAIESRAGTPPLIQDEPSEQESDLEGPDDEDPDDTDPETPETEPA